MQENAFELVKGKVDARELAKKILGEPPVKSGETWKWNSPFREGDNDPSLCANDVSITDFGGDFKGDIYTFVVAMGLAPNNFEALKYIANEFNIELPIYTTQYTQYTQNTVKKAKVKKYFNLVATENTVEEIFCMFDNTAFTRKPTGEEIGKIKNNISNLQPMAYPLEDIKTKLITGHTCIPAGIKSQNDWQDGVSFYQIFMVDIDNVKTVNGVKQKITVDNEEHVTVDKIINYCKRIGLLPTFVYYTFSHTEQQHKFRLVYILDVATQSQDVVKAIYNGFKETFKDYNIDTAPSNIATMFFGGKKIAYESNIFYTIEEVEKEEEDTSQGIDLPAVEVIDNNDLKQCIQALEGSQYIVGNGKLWYVRSEKSITPISNFIAYPIEKITLNNGRDEQVTYKMKCLLLDNLKIEMPTQIITMEQLQKSNYILGSKWDKYAIVHAGTTNADKIREVSQLEGRQLMEEKQVYTHTGFIRVNGELVYLYHGGAIGKNTEGILTDLSNDGLQRYCFTDKEFNTQQALQRSLSVKDVASYDITIPLWITGYASVLYSLLKSIGINADYVLYIQGKSGTRKSSLTAMELSHFGNFTRDTFPSSFRDTLNSIEKIAFILKDSLNVVDDFNPEVLGGKKLEVVEKIFGMYGDRTGRTRMSKDGTTLKIPYTARGLCIITGEVLPEVAQSRIARSLIINIKEDSINLNKLAELQDNTEELAFAMKTFIMWVIENEERITDFAKDRFKKMQRQQEKGVHGRTKEIANILTLVLKIVTQFFMDYNVLDENQKGELDSIGEEVLNQLIEQQTQEITQLKPTEMFYNAIDQMFMTEKIKVLDYQTQREIDIWQGTNVGYYNDKEKLFYFFPDIIYSKVVEFYSSTGIKFPINEKALWKYLCEEKKLEKQDDKRYRAQKTISGNKVSIVQIKPGAYIPKKVPFNNGFYNGFNPPMDMKF